MHLAAHQLLEVSPATLVAWASDCAAMAVATNREKLIADRQLDAALAIANTWQTAEDEALTANYKTVSEIVTQFLIANDNDNVVALDAAMCVEKVTQAARAAKRGGEPTVPQFVEAAVNRACTAGVSDAAARLLRLMNVPTELWAIAEALIGDGVAVAAALEASATLT